jgi:hypothetical protein
MTNDKLNGCLIRAVALFAISFGLLTIIEGGAVVFDSGTARKDAGNYVPFILWFNFLAGFAYVVAGAGLWLQRRWAVRLATVIAIATVTTFITFGFHIYMGGAHEMRTVFAMSLRTGVWAIIAVLSWRVIAVKAKEIS